LASRRLAALWVATLSSLATGILLLGLAWLMAGPLTPSAFVWGLATGAALAVGLLAYYVGFARGSFGLVSAITGVWSAIVPVVVGLGFGERPAWLALVGVALLIAAIALVSGGQQGGAVTVHGVARDPGLPPPAWWRRMPSGFFEATVAGLGFGLVFVFLGQAQAGHPLWPVVVSILMAGGILCGVALWRRPPLRVDRGLWGLLLLAGLLQAGATVAFVLAVRGGFLSIVAVAGAMSPIPTAAAAWLFLRERLSGLQRLGFVAAMLGILAIALG
ncbi:MAG: EamA family transporter, partial [Thioalkalivibrionaceae bacterium]